MNGPFTSSGVIVYGVRVDLLLSPTSECHVAQLGCPLAGRPWLS